MPQTASSKLKFFTKSWRLLKISVQPSSCSLFNLNSASNDAFSLAQSYDSWKFEATQDVKDDFLSLGWWLCCCHTNKPALSTTIQTRELFLPTAKHLQTKWHCSFEVYFRSTCLSLTSGANKMMFSWCLGNLLLKCEYQSSFFSMLCPKHKAPWHLSKIGCKQQ